MVENNLLIHELQLGEQLNECVHSKRRADFSLMLAMLVDDVREHSQFIVPKSMPALTQVTDESLRREFKLPDKAPLSIDDYEQISTYNQADLVAEKRMTELRLVNALQPKPLAFRNDNHHIESQVMSNTSLYCQRRHKEKSEAQLKQRLPFNAKGWLSDIQETIVKSSLINVHSTA
ncbi:VC2046/SO_2500 family protein [Colwelliaceae bacterium 6471]